jgi:hypothetical protein
MQLSSALFHALANLERKKAGVDGNWINISDARELTLLGLASRDHQGWKITEAGLEAFKSQSTEPDSEQPTAQILPHRPA